MSNRFNRVNTHKEGFTIIEVLIVLAIGAVIMLAVFLVVPQLQQTQRNARQQDNARRVLTAIQQYAAANNNKFPLPAAILPLTAAMTNPYTNSAVVDADIATGTVASSPLGTTTTAGKFWIFQNAKCDPNSGGKNTLTQSGGFAVIASVQPNGANGFCVNL